MTKESRLTALDSLRGFGILLVVLGHTSQTSGLVSWIFSFHMPLFFIISGMLFHERQFLDSFKRRAIRLLVPYVFFGTVTLAYWALIERRLRGDEGSVPNALANIVLARAGSDNYPQNAALWFLPCLFVTEMLFLGFFLLVNKAGSVETKTVMGGWRNRIAVMALALVSFLSIIVMWSLDLPVDQFRLPWAFDILSFSMLFYCIGYLLVNSFSLTCNRPPKRRRWHILRLLLSALLGFIFFGCSTVGPSWRSILMEHLPTIHFGCYVQHCLVLYRRSYFALLSTAGCCSSLAGRRLPSCACMNR